MSDQTPSHPSDGNVVAFPAAPAAPTTTPAPVEPTTLEAFVARHETEKESLQQQLTAAIMAQATLQLTLHDANARLRHLIHGAQPHRPPGVKIRNPRVLVFEDALVDLAELLDRPLPTNLTPQQLGNICEQERLEMRQELLRYQQLLQEFEAQIGAPSGVDPQTPTIVRFEAMVRALLALAAARKNAPQK